MTYLDDQMKASSHIQIKCLDRLMDRYYYLYFSVLKMINFMIELYLIVYSYREISVLNPYKEFLVQLIGLKTKTSALPSPRNLF